MNDAVTDGVYPAKTASFSSALFDEIKMKINALICS